MPVGSKCLDDPRGIVSDDRIVGDVVGDDRAGIHDEVPAYRDARKDDRPDAYPCVLGVHFESHSFS